MVDEIMIKVDERATGKRETGKVDVDVDVV